MASWQNYVTVEQFKDFGDFYAYCEVFNYHFENRPHWSNGVADVILAHNMYGIFDGHTNKGYFINGDKFAKLSDKMNYVHRQVANCRAKYNGTTGNLAIQQRADMEQQRYLAMQRDFDR